MADKMFRGLEQFSTFLERGVVLQIAALAVTAEAASVLMEEKIKAVYGDETKLAPLAPATQEERANLGYSTDEPLLRTGELLRDSVHHEAAGPLAVAGSDEPIAAYQEYGFYNHRTGNMVPPRPAFKIGLEEAMSEIIEIASIATFSAANGMISKKP